MILQSSINFQKLIDFFFIKHNKLGVLLNKYRKYEF